MATLLRVQAVTAAYGARVAVRDVSFCVDAGELVVVLGPNGAGKSTLVKSCIGLHPLAGGQVELLGTSLARASRRAVAQRVAWVPQSSGDALGFTGLELVLLGRSPHLGLWGLPSSRDVARARAAMEELGLSHLADRPMTALSGGERRLLLLARALAQAPELLVLDEPTAFLDLRHQVEMLALLRRRARAGLGVLAVLHDVNLAALFGDRALLMRDGALLALGAVREVLEPRLLERLYGLPMLQAEVESGHRLFAPRVEP